MTKVGVLGIRVDSETPPTRISGNPCESLPSLAIGVETMSRYFITICKGGGFNVIEKVSDNKYIIYPTLPFPKKFPKTSKPVKFF